MLKSHRMRSRIVVYAGLNGGEVYSSQTSSNPNQGIVDGEVSVQDEAVRRRLSLRLVDGSSSLTPASARDIFTPYGNVVKAWRGIYLPDGSVEEHPLGVFGISDVEIDDAGAGVQITCTAYDLARKVQRAKAINDQPIAAGAPGTTIIRELITTAVPGVITNLVEMPYVLPAYVIKMNDDKWAKAQAIAAAMGCELFFDVNGVCILRRIPNYSTQPIDWTYAEGSQATLLYTNKRYTDEDTFNYFIVTGENSSLTTPVRGDAFDDDPRSPTFYRGKYGVVVQHASMDTVTTNAMATAAAQGMLQKSIGSTERIHFNAIVNGTHEVGDVVEVKRAKSKINDKYVLSNISLPLVHSRAMDCVTRKRSAA